MSRENFWSGFIVGAAAGTLAGLGVSALLQGRFGEGRDDVLRLEKSVNIGRPVQEVFAAWSDLERLPDYIKFVESVQRSGNHTRWAVNIDGRRFDWQAEITQQVANESLGWKSHSGPKHTGRISFAPLGDQTVVHVLMNYVPPMGRIGAAFPIESHLEQWIERGLREFKARLENGPQRSTGTIGRRL